MPTRKVAGRTTRAKKAGSTSTASTATTTPPPSGQRHDEQSGQPRDQQSGQRHDQQSGQPRDQQSDQPRDRASAQPHGQRRAAHRAVARSHLELRLPIVGEVVLPEPAHLAWYAGVAALAALEIIEWPIAVVLAVGKALADSHGDQTLEEFGQALEEVT